MNSGAGCLFLPIILFFGFFGILIVGFIVLVVYLINKGKNMAWKGTLINKLFNEKRDSESNRMEYFYTLVFKTEEGKELKVGVSREVYDDYKIGDKAKKDKGKLQPEKIKA